MAINVVIPFLIDLEDNINNATRLLPSNPPGPLQFTEMRYCSVLPENAKLSSPVYQVEAVHKEGLPVSYSITGGNRDGLFTIDRRTGRITLAAHLDYELQDRHLLEVSAEAGKSKSKTSLHVLVADVNDNPPEVKDFSTKIAVVEEDDRNVPRILTQIEATDLDLVDEGSLRFSLSGEGVGRDTPGGPIFAIDSETGKIFLLRAVDRDPPYGRSIYKIKVHVHDGHRRGTKAQDIHNSASIYNRSKGNYRRDKRTKVSGKRKPTHHLDEKIHGEFYTMADSAFVDLPESDTSNWRINDSLLKRNRRRRSLLAINDKNEKLHHPKFQKELQVGLNGLLFIENGSDPQSTWQEMAANKNDEKLRKFSLSTNDNGIMNMSRPELKSEISKKRKFVFPQGDNTETKKTKIFLGSDRKLKILSSFEAASNVSETNTPRGVLPNIFDSKQINQKSINQFGGLNEITKLPTHMKTVNNSNNTICSYSILNKVRTMMTIQLRKHLIQNITRKPKFYGNQDYKKNSLISKLLNKQIVPTCPDEFSKVLTDVLHLKSKVFHEELKAHNSLQTLHDNYMHHSHHAETPINSISGLLEYLRFICIATNREDVEDILSRNNFNNQVVENNIICSHVRSCFEKKKLNYKFSLLQALRKQFAANKLPHFTVKNSVTPSEEEFHLQSPDSGNANVNLNAFPSTGNMNCDTTSLVNLLLSFQHSKVPNLRSKRNSIFSRKKQIQTEYSIRPNSHSTIENGAAESLRLKKRFRKHHEQRIKKSRREHHHFVRLLGGQPNKQFHPPAIQRNFPAHQHKDRYAADRGKRDTVLFSEAATSGNNGTVTKGFCVLSDPAIKMVSHGHKEGTSDSYNEQPLAPFMSWIYLDTDTQHVDEIVVTVIVKDINDNAPVFPNSTMYGEVQENGPIDLSITTVEAWDADDATSGTNAHLTYSLEKNVIDERTGQPLFTISPRSGELRTSLCCLDRETTPEYRIQVVASDGGGLKGTGTVVVRLADVNDNKPHLVRKDWTVTIPESYGNDGPNNETILEITVNDPDISNYFFYRVVESSGRGWEQFDIRTVGSVGELYATKTLDYEKEMHRRGFRFAVQVTDRGRGGWSDSKHVDTAYVSVFLQDVNDNDPLFEKNFELITISEDTPLQTILTRMAASDPDQGDNGIVEYFLLDPWGRLKIDTDGNIKIRQQLDREGPGGATDIIKVLAVDKGDPRRSATGTLTVSLSDINDCPPRLLPPHILHLSENVPTQRIGEIHATDDDVWSLGHGPPFTFSLAQSNPTMIKEKISLIFKPELDSGRGGAELWTRKPLDREEHSFLTVEIAVSDAEGLMTSQPIFLVVDDVNDNTMKPGKKTVYLWKTRDARTDASLGRIYVEDPDDWDTEDKLYKWKGLPHPLFSLDENTGSLYASGHLREGRYDLQFDVSDQLWEQTAVRADVSVMVHVLSQEALSNAIPLSLSPTSPPEITRNWNPMKGGGTLGSLTESVKQIVNSVEGTVMVVSVYGRDDNSPIAENTKLEIDKDKEALPTTCIWLSFKQPDNHFMNPVKLRGILEMNLHKLRETINLFVHLEDPTLKTENTASTPVHSKMFPLPPTGFNNLEGYTNLTKSLLQTSSSDLTSATLMASTALPLQVVDNNSTSFVTPRLSLPYLCIRHFNHQSIPFNDCHPDLCLNGGKCTRTDIGKRCVCPGGSTGPYCKITSRSFGKGGWAWINPLPPCKPMLMTLKILTLKADGIIFYSGPLTSSSYYWDNFSAAFPTKMQKYPDINPLKERIHRAKYLYETASGISQFYHHRNALGYSPKPTQLFILQLLNGKPHLHIEGEVGPLTLNLNSSQPLNDGEWHSIRLEINDKGVSLMIDYCASMYTKSSPSYTSCYAEKKWSNKNYKLSIWSSSSPLQIGGVAHTIPPMRDHGWSLQPSGSSFEGCMSDFRIGDNIIDLGSPAYNHMTSPGCEPQEKACLAKCNGKGSCVGGLGSSAHCECPPGYTDAKCASETTPVSLNRNSFAKVALSSTNDQRFIQIMLRIRTRLRYATILHLKSETSQNALILHLQDGIGCLSLVATHTSQISQNVSSVTSSGYNQSSARFPIKTSKGLPVSYVCVSRLEINDGEWHVIKGEKQGGNLILEMDGGDLGQRNESLRSFSIEQAEYNQTAKFKIDIREGVTIGGLPKFSSGVATEVHDDLHDSCLDDVRIFGKQVPLPLILNETKWGQMTTFQGFERGCNAPDSCLGVKCSSPLVCRDEWRQSSCRCPLGQRMFHNGCREMDLCLLGPCLNGGSCIQNDGGTSCLCTSQYTGHHCEWRLNTSHYTALLNPMIIISVAVSLFVFALVLMIIGVAAFTRSKKKRKRKEAEEVSQGKVMSDSGEMEVYYIFDKEKYKDESDCKNQPPPCQGIQHICHVPSATTVESVVAESSSSTHDDVAPCVIMQPKRELTAMIPQDDLRAYAYEGEGSSAGSLASALSGQIRASSGVWRGVNHSATCIRNECGYRSAQKPP